LYSGIKFEGDGYAGEAPALPVQTLTRGMSHAL
jgi:hypothetical protein